MTVRLSPNEEAAILRQERDRRRKLRIQQVREQERQFARKVRTEVKQRRVVELQLLAETLQQTWLREQEEKKSALRKDYAKNLDNIGEGHKAAASQEPQDEKRAVTTLLNKQAANHRHNVALERFRAEEDEQRQKDHAHILSRLTALEIEKSRAAKIAKLPPPAKENAVDSKPSQPVKCVEDFSTTHYHVTTEYVEKADLHEQGDARAAAVEEEQRIKQQREETERELKERHEKAILRHKHAHKRALLEQDMDRLMDELGQMEQADRRRRQAVVAKIPHQVFQPPHRRMEEREEQQMNLEQAFEDMYMANTEFTGDLTLALEPVVPEGDQDLDLTTESSVGQTLQPTLLPHGGDDKDMEVTSSKPLSRSETLQKLMKRIHNQRQGSRDKSSQDLSTAPVGHLVGEGHLGDPSEENRPDRSSEPSPAPESQTGSTKTSSSTTTIDKSSELSQHPISSLGNNRITPPSSDHNGGSETNVANFEPVISGSASLMHPMEHAAIIRSSKLPDMSQLRRDQEHIIQRDEEQRQRLAQQQLVSHTEQQDHLHTLQRNLHVRQQALDQQIKENIEQRHKVAFDDGRRSVESGRNAPETLHEPDVKQGDPLISGQNMHQDGSAISHSENDNVRQEQSKKDRQIEIEIHPSHSIDQSKPPKQLYKQGSVPVYEQNRIVPNAHTPAQSIDQNQPKNLFDNQVLEPVPDRTVPDAHLGQIALPPNSALSPNNRIRKYQLQLLAQQRESRNALHEAQTRLQQRRLNLLKEYPEISLPKYSPYVASSKGQESNVIISQAEKELKPVSVTSENGSPGIDMPHSGVLDFASKHFLNQHPESADSNQQMIGKQTSMPSDQLILYGQLPLQEHGEQVVTRIGDSQIAQPNCRRTIPQTRGVEPALVIMSGTDEQIQNQQTIRSAQPNLHRTIPQNRDVESPLVIMSGTDGQIPNQQTSFQQPIMPAQLLQHQPEHPVHAQLQNQQLQGHPLAPDQQMVFREFLKNQKEKLEQRNKENETRLKEKQEQLREQIKRQMEQYRQVFLSEHQGANEQHFGTDVLPNHSSHLELPSIQQGEDLQSGFLPQVQSQEEPEEIQDLDLFQRDFLVERQRNAPAGALSRSHHRPPSASRLLPDQGQYMQPHELSTIIEVETPRSERTSMAGRYSHLSSSNDTAVGFGFHQYDKSGLVPEFGDQGLMSNVQLDMEKILDDDDDKMGATSLYHSEIHIRQKSPDVSRSASHDAVKQMKNFETHKLTKVSSEVEGIASKQYVHTTESDFIVGSQFSTSRLQNIDLSMPPEFSINIGDYVDDTTRGRSQLESLVPTTVPLRSELPKSVQPIDVKSDSQLPKSHSAISLNSKPDHHGELIGTVAGHGLSGSLSMSSIPVTSEFQLASQEAFERQGNGTDNSYARSGMMTYPTTEIQPTQSMHSHTPSTMNEPVQQKTMYTVEKDDLRMNPLSPSGVLPFLSVVKTPDLSEIKSPSVIPSMSKEPVIEISQPMVVNSPSSSDNTLSSQQDQFFTPLPNRSFGSGSSSSPDDTPGNNNGVIQWGTPTTAERGSFRIDSSKTGAHFPHSVNIPSQYHQMLDKGSPGQMHGGLKWKELLEGNVENSSLVNQSGVSLLSEHPMSTNFDQGDQESTQQTNESRQDGNNPSMPGTRIMDMAQTDYQPNISDFSQHSYMPIPYDSEHGKRLLQTVFSPSGSHRDNLSRKSDQKQQSAVFERHSSGSYRRVQHDSQYPEMSAAPIDPSYSYTGFLPSHHSSKISDLGEMSGAHHVDGTTEQDLVDSRRRDLVSNSDRSPSEVPPHLRTNVIMPDVPAYPELSQHTIDASLYSAIQDSQMADTGSHFDPSHSRMDPSKGSFSSIEEARSQPDVNYRLMPMFSDVSISQQSVSFDSEQGHGVNQGQSSSVIINPTPAKSDRYSLPRTFMNERVTGRQAAVVDGRPQMVFQRWRDGRSESVGQSSVDSGENQFQPLQEITSSTLTGYGHTDSLETGILEEPDLTLVSLNTTQFSMEQDHLHESLMESILTENPGVRTSDVTQAQATDKENVQPSDTSDGSGLSLQEAFARRKAGFIKASTSRQQDVKIRASDQGATAVSTILSKKKLAHKPKGTKSNTAKDQDKANGKTVQTKGTSRNISADSSDNGSSSQSSAKGGKRSKNNSNDAGSSRLSAMQGVGSKTTTSAGRKAAEKEMKKRTSRLYNQLEEVKQRKLEKNRQEQYAVFRQKRKDFEQKLQTRLNKWANQKPDN